MGLNNSPPHDTYYRYGFVSNPACSYAKEEINPEHSDLSYDSHKEVLDKLFTKESNMISINDINQNDYNAIMDI